MTKSGPAPTGALAPASSSVRYSGIDAARGLAIVGMMAAHVWPRDDAQSELLVDGRPSMLFAVVAGVSLGIVTSRSEPDAVPRSTARWRLLIRAVLLIALGLLSSLSARRYSSPHPYCGIRWSPEGRPLNSRGP